jgi:hypothetical protein
VSRFLTSRAAAANTTQILAVGADGLAWTEVDATGQTKPKQVFWNPEQGIEFAAATWNKTLNQRQWPAHADVLVCLQSDVVHHWLQAVPGQTQSLAELHSVATARAKLLFGDSGKHRWLVSANWDYQRPFLCTAISSEWEELFQTIRKTHAKLRIVSNLALSLSLHASTLPKQGWLAMLLENKLHLMHFHNSHITSLRTLRLPEYDTLKGVEAAVTQEWNREKIRTQQNAEKLHWFRLPTSTTINPLIQHTSSVLHQALQQTQQLLSNGAHHAP